MIFQRFFILLILEISHQRFQKFNSKDIESVKIEHPLSRLGLYNTDFTHWYGTKPAAGCARGINYFADLRMTFRQNFFLQDWFRNKFGVGLG